MGNEGLCVCDRATSSEKRRGKPTISRSRPHPPTCVQDPGVSVDLVSPESGERLCYTWSCLKKQNKNWNFKKEGWATDLGQDLEVAHIMFIFKRLLFFSPDFFPFR